MDRAKPAGKSAVHLVMEPVPDFSTPMETQEGILLAPVADLVRMKLTSYRLKD